MLKEVKVRTPDPASFAGLPSLRADGLMEHQQVEHVILSGSLAGRSLSSLSFESTLIDNVDGAKARLHAARIVDSVLRSSDFANSDWTGGAFRRCRVERCRLTGLIASECVLDNVCFADCTVDLSVFMQSEFKSVIFDRCRLTEASFDGADLRRARFNDCDLTSAVFVRADMNGADLRGSRLCGVAARPQDLRGAVIDASQAADLVHLLQVHIA